METRRLKAFIQIVDTGSLTRAAQLLNVAQPALSQQVLALEAEFGAQLLTRSRHGVTPTAAGTSLYRQANLILKQIENARHQVSSIGGELSGQVAIGMPLSVTAVLIVPLTRMVRQRYPSISLDFTDGLPASLAAELTVNGRLDIAFLPTKIVDNALELFPLLTECLALVTSPENELSHSVGPIRLPDIADHPLILPGKHIHLRQTIDEMMTLAGVIPRVVAEMNSVFALCAAAAAQLGSAIVPLAASSRANPHQLVVRVIVEPEILRPLYLGRATYAPLSPQAAAVWDLIVGLTADLVHSGGWVGARSSAGEESSPPLASINKSNGYRAR
jgi:LysR family transcriptional regulator, nitrogen assimilation regulatory protein